MLTNCVHNLLTLALLLTPYNSRGAHGNFIETLRGIKRGSPSTLVLKFHPTTPNVRLLVRSSAGMKKHLGSRKCPLCRKLARCFIALRAKKMRSAQALACEAAEASAGLLLRVTACPFSSFVKVGCAIHKLFTTVNASRSSAEGTPVNNLRMA